MGVPRPGQQPGLAGRPGRDLDHDQAVGQVRLLGEEHAGEAPAPELAAEQVGPDRVARLRQALPGFPEGRRPRPRCRRRAEQTAQE